MTANGLCHKCGKLASSFYYTKPHTPENGHQGYWHCFAHGPGDGGTASPQNAADNSDERRSLNRAQRRALGKKKK